MSTGELPLRASLRRLTRAVVLVGSFWRMIPLSRSSFGSAWSGLVLTSATLSGPNPMEPLVGGEPL